MSRSATEQVLGFIFIGSLLLWLITGSLFAFFLGVSISILYQVGRRTS